MSNSAQAWLDRTDPRAAQMVADPRDLDPAAKAEKERVRAWFEAGSRRQFERECAADGIDPAAGVSPSLLKVLGLMPEQNAEAEQ